MKRLPFEETMTDILFDSHAHLISDDWGTYPPSPLRGAAMPGRIDYAVTAEWLVGEMDRLGVGKACLVQRGHVYGYDNRYIIDSAKRHPDRFVSVVMLDAQDPATPEIMTDMVRNQGVRGVRFAQTYIEDYDTAWMNSRNAMKSWQTAADLGVSVTIIIFRRHLAWALPALEFLARTYPSLPIIIDHTGTPYNASNFEVGRERALGVEVMMPDGPDFGIADTIGRFETLENVLFKFTEINLDRLAEKGGDAATYVRRLADRFGAGRMMWGSDVGQSRRPYDHKVAEAKEAAALLSAEERQAFLSGTTARIFGA